MKKGGLLFALAAFVFSLYLSMPYVNRMLDKNPSLLLQEKGKQLPPFSFSVLSDGNFSNQNLLNHWTLFFIGYTFCPDICPTTLADLDRVYAKLTQAPYSNMQIVFVSVDPNRDKAKHLAEYVNYFNSHFTGVTSSHQQLFPFAQNLGLVYSIVDQPQDQFYLIDHSASLVLINPNGEHHATFQAVINENGIPHVNMDLMVEDIHRLQDNWQ